MLFPLSPKKDTVSEFNVFFHGAIAGLALIEFAVVAVRYRARQVVGVVTLALLYVVFSVIRFWCAPDDAPLYPFLDWKVNKVRAAVYSFGALSLAVVLFMVLFGASELKVRNCRKMREVAARPSHSKYGTASNASLLTEETQT